MVYRNVTVCSRTTSRGPGIRAPPPIGGGAVVSGSCNRLSVADGDFVARNSQADKAEESGAMNFPLVKIRLDPVLVFKARTEARALLWQAGEFDLHEAVDKLQADDVRDGLVDAIGQDQVQRILSDAFAAVRDDLEDR
jgi:hypothetical protein